MIVSLSTYNCSGTFKWLFEKVCFFYEELTDNRREALEQRFCEIAKQYEPMIMKICFGYASCRQDMDDLFQDSLVNIWQGLPRFKGESSLKTWVYRVTLNTCVSTVRRRREVPRSDLVEFYSVIDESEERRRLVTEMHNSIACLSPVDKAIVLMWLDEFNYDEIGATVGMPRNTVATRLRRAKEKLKKL